MKTNSSFFGNKLHQVSYLPIKDIDEKKMEIDFSAAAAQNSVFPESPS